MLARVEWRAGPGEDERFGDKAREDEFVEVSHRVLGATWSVSRRLLVSQQPGKGMREVAVVLGWRVEIAPPGDH
jgi:hypothetical protein